MVTQNKVARSCQGGKNAEVGLVARRKEKHGFHVEVGGEGSLQLAVLGEIADDQPGRAGTKSGTRNGSGGGGGQGRVARKAEVVVGAEGDKGLTVDGGVCS
jgi:hypothetical protein